MDFNLDEAQQEIADLARNSFRASFADEHTIAAGVAAIDDVIGDSPAGG